VRSLCDWFHLFFFTFDLWDSKLLGDELLNATSDPCLACVSHVHNKDLGLGLLQQSLGDSLLESHASVQRSVVHQVRAVGAEQQKSVAKRVKLEILTA
jgi:hypothetical protein